MKKRFLTAILASVMMICLLPQATFAADSGIQLGTVGLKAGDEVYLGVYTEGLTDYNVPWAVLSPGILRESAAATPTNALPLLSKYLLGASSFRSTAADWGYYNDSDNIQGGFPDSSVVKTIMDRMYYGDNKLFTAAEQTAVMDTTLAGESMHITQPALRNQKLFPLSLSEATNAVGAGSATPAVFISTGTSGHWWLRTSYDSFMAWYTDFAGPLPIPTYIGDFTGMPIGLRPAFHLDLSTILFTSPAVGGKASGPDALNANMTPSGTTSWKLTLKDAARSGFTITTTALSATSANVSYANAKTGANEYLSAMIVDNGSVIYYDRLLLDGTTNGASGSGTVNIPAGVMLDSDTTLYLFNEQCNGDQKTDYASDLLAVTEPSQDNSDPIDDSVPYKPSFGHIPDLNAPSFTAGKSAPADDSNPNTGIGGCASF